MRQHRSNGGDPVMCGFAALYSCRMPAFAGMTMEKNSN
jgi:hypothetical protein